jgi:hypothetical protein
MMFFQGLPVRGYIFSLLLWLFSTGPAPAIQQEHPARHSPVASSILEPVYGPLSEQIVGDFQLADRKGTGIDLGSDPGRPTLVPREALPPIQ